MRATGKPAAEPCYEPPSSHDPLVGTGPFDRLDPGLRRQLVTSARSRRYERGALLYAEGAASEELLLLMSGGVVLFRSVPADQRTILGVVRPPGAFGEEALAGSVPRVTSAEAIQESFAFALPEPELTALMLRHPAIGDAARHWLARQLGRITEQRADDVLLDLPGRVSKALLELAVEDGSAAVVAGVSQGVLAALARGSRQRVNQVLRRLADQGSVRMERGHIVITDPTALAACRDECLSTAPGPLR